MKPREAIPQFSGRVGHQLVSSQSNIQLFKVPHCFAKVAVMRPTWCLQLIKVFSFEV